MSPPLRFETLPTPLHDLTADALKAVAAAHDVLAALARARAADRAAHEKIWGTPPARFSRAVTQRQRRALTMLLRDREIMRLARRGLSNAVIGARVGLHPVTVCKIIRRVLRGNG
jgi:DNA-binding NarL/FixJ family response regulator